VANRGQRREQIEASQRNRQRRREHMERFIERFRSKSTKASQVQSRIKMLEKLNDEGGEHLPPPLPETHISLPAPPHCGIEVLRVDRAGLSYDGNRWIFRHFDLRIERGEKLAVVGLNGMGKTTLLRVLAGDLPLTEGRRTQGHGVALRYHAQETARELHPERTVFETARSAAPDMPERELRTFLGAFRFPGEAVDKRVEVLSGGEKVRLSLSRLLLDPANVLILDEPTTHLDVSSREALEEALRVYTGTVCLVSHDISFIRNVATGIIAITASGLKRYYGDYTYYREKVREEQETAATDPPAVELGSEPGMAGASGDRRARRREEAVERQKRARERAPWEKRLRDAEERVEVLEQEQARLLESLGDPAGATDYAAVNRRLHDLQQELAAATSAWEEAALVLEEMGSL
jgi:ATP-binding cassette subfamily F protein 3